jgi:hypothetical protein
MEQYRVKGYVMGELSAQQVKVLLGGLNASRVATRQLRGNSGPTLSYLEAWDVKAHLNRVFGFTNWSWTITESQIAFEDAGTGSSGKNYTVGYRVAGTLTVNGANYCGVAIGTASIPDRGDAHDMALKTADSDALKRAATMLGDQFGLSLYNNGSLAPVVMAVLAPGQAATLEPANPAEDFHVETPAEPAVPAVDEEAVVRCVEMLRTAAMESVAAVIEARKAITAEGLIDAVFEGRTLAKITDEAVAFAGRRAAAATTEEATNG